MTHKIIEWNDHSATSVYFLNKYVTILVIPRFLHSKPTFLSNRPKMNDSKYKLHKMQEKIESEERDNSNRASFMCPNCQKTFTDLEVSLTNTFIS